MFHAEGLDGASIHDRVADDLGGMLDSLVVYFGGSEHDQHLHGICSDHNGHGAEHDQRHLPAVDECDDHAHEHGAHGRSLGANRFAKCAHSESPKLQGFGHHARSVLGIIVETDLLAEDGFQDIHPQPRGHGLCQDSKAAMLDDVADLHGGRDDKENEAKEDDVVTGLVPHSRELQLEKGVHGPHQRQGADGSRRTLDQSTQNGRHEEGPLRFVVSQESRHRHFVLVGDLLLPVLFFLLHALLPRP